MPSPAKVVEIAQVSLDDISLPATSIKIDLGDRRAYIFTMSTAARLKLDPVRFRKLAQSLGDLVHPANAMLVVLPDGESLGAYRVEAE